MSLMPPPNEASDIFSISDQALSERFQFVEEIGFGNWGSVWLCRPKDDDEHPIALGDDPVADANGVGVEKVAVKLVHRSKTPTTAARVRSLWNEMKIVRSFKNDPHPSIIPFHNFIITPSYALITMAYLPTLVPVEVPELRAKPWFLSLISAVAFLHARGVVHNDIKPANILLTAANPPVPVLVDFGFAEKYDVRSSKAFLSNLAYGTPEYLSPERARGLPHDTRKSDVWSLGVTIFEILRGRTPFEHADVDGTTETFSTKADLEKYWARTVKGKWIGKWTMSRGLEKLLRKMILPNADLRITAPVALNDPYFDPGKPETPRRHQSRSSLTTHSPSSSEADASRLVEVGSPWAGRSGPGTGLSPPPSLIKTVAAAATRRSNANLNPTSGKENVRTPPNISSISRKEVISGSVRRDNSHGQRTPSTKGVSSQNKFTAVVQPFKHGARKAPSFNAGPSGATSPSTLSPASGPLTSRRFANSSTNTSASPNPDSSLLTPISNRASDLTASSFASKENNVPGSRTSSGRRVPVRKPVPAIFAAHKGNRRNDNAEKIVYEDVFAEKVEREEEKGKEKERDKHKKNPVFTDLTTKTNGAPVLESGKGEKLRLTPVVETDSPRLFPNDTFPRSLKESTGIGALKQSIKQSLDKGVRLYKSSALGSYSNLLAKQSTGGLSVVAPECSRTRGQGNERISEDTKESWENDSAVRTAKSSLPIVRHAIRNEQVAADNRLDRMTIWIRNVERVVEDARANFAAGSMTPLPPLPPRVPPSARRPIKADQIFRDENNGTIDGTDNSLASRPRRATLLSCSPEPHSRENNVEWSQDGRSSSLENKEGPKGRTKSAHDLSRPITPLTKLQFEVNRRDVQPRSPTRLSAVVDPNVFFAPKRPEYDSDLSIAERSYTPAERSSTLLTPTSTEPKSFSPSGRESTAESTSDRVLMASSSVVRLGKGYQSNLLASNTVVDHVQTSVTKRNPKLFLSARRGGGGGGGSGIPRSETPRKSVSVDELGALNSTQTSTSMSSASRREDGNNTIRLMRRAFKAILTGGGSTSRRLSKAP